MIPDILSNLVITKVCLAATMYSPQHRASKRNDRERWAIIIKYEGETVYCSNGKYFVSNLNHIIILPKGVSYHWECTQAGHFSIVEFECEQTFHEPISFNVKHGDKILKCFRDLEYKRNLRSPMYELESMKEAYSIILQLVQANEEKYIPSSKRQKLQPAIEYISQNYGQVITNDLLAYVSGMSTVYFRKQFTEVMGVSPIAYVKKLRIEKAKEMLQSDYRTLTDVAQSLGYANLYDFSRDFKRHTGIAPSMY